MTTAPQEWISFLWELKYAEKMAVAGISGLNRYGFYSPQLAALQKISSHAIPRCLPRGSLFIKDELKVASNLP